jgi:alkylhydroperoxidase family enzyme
MCKPKTLTNQNYWAFFNKRGKLYVDEGKKEVETMARLPEVNVEGTPFKKALANSPTILEAFQQMDKALNNILEPELMEMLRLRSASNNGCDY